MQAPRREGLTNPGPRRIDVRVGSSASGVISTLGTKRAPTAGLPQWVGLGVVALAAFLADQLTKQIVIRELSLGESLDVGGPLQIHHVRNSGIAFGLFSSFTAIVTASTLVAILWMLVYFARSGARHPVLPAALGLLVGGSLANLTDRLRLGHVTDYIDFDFWPAFNLADTFICIGVALLLGSLIGRQWGSRLSFSLHTRGY